MSIPLIDFRGKITPETDAVLEAIQRSTGRDKSEIAREWMHKIAEREIERLENELKDYKSPYHFDNSDERGLALVIIENQIDHWQNILTELNK